MGRWSGAVADPDGHLYIVYARHAHQDDAEGEVFVELRNKAHLVLRPPTSLVNTAYAAVMGLIRSGCVEAIEISPRRSP